MDVDYHNTLYWISTRLAEAAPGEADKAGRLDRRNPFQKNIVGTLDAPLASRRLGADPVSFSSVLISFYHNVYFDCQYMDRFSSAVLDCDIPVQTIPAIPLYCTCQGPKYFATLQRRLRCKK